MEANNPYAPPKAAVEDVASGEQPPRPAQVTRAVQLFWAAVAVSLVSGVLNAYLLETPGFSRGAYAIMMVIGWIVVGAIVWWILSSIGKGKNWARIVQLVLVMFGILGMLTAFTMPQVIPGVVRVLYAVQVGLNLWGILLVFSGPANAWFREMKDWL